MIFSNILGLFIWHKIAIQVETVFAICSLKLSVESSWIPRSLAEIVGVILFSSNVTCKSSGNRCNILGVPSTNTLVLSGLISRLLWQHHAVIFDRSSLIFHITSLTYLMGNERYNFESSTYDSKSPKFGMVGKSFKYILNKAGPNIEPCGTLWVIRPGSDTTEPIFTCCILPVK